MGVSALAKSLVAVLTALDPETDIAFLIPSPASGTMEIELENSSKTVRIVNYRLSPCAKPSTHMALILFAAMLYRAVPLRFFRRAVLSRFDTIRATVEANWIGDIRGGDSFSDIYGLKRMVFRSFSFMVAWLLHRRYVLLPQKYGPFNGRLASAFAALTIRRASMVWSRDGMGDSVVRSLTRDRGARFCPDVAFMLPVRRPVSMDFSPPVDLERDSPLVGLNVSGLLWSGGYSRSNMFGLSVDYKRLMRTLVDRIRERYSDSSILLVPHTYASSEDVENDLHAILELWKSCGDDNARLHVCSGAYNESELKWIIGRCSAFIGSRMHSCIAALSQNVPTCGLAYSDKFRGVFETLQMGNLVSDLRDGSVESISDDVLRMIESRDAIHEQLRPINREVHSSILRAFSEMTGRLADTQLWFGNP
jgi:colanic acid/amylovoran biosynthesis protein